MNLSDVLSLAAERSLEGWLYLRGSYTDWRLDSEAFVAEFDIDSDPDEPTLPEPLRGLGLVEVLDAGTLEQVVTWADELVGRADQAVRLQSLIWYYRFDSFLPEVGAPEPPSAEESQRLRDREFYESLGSEDLARSCKRDGCTRGAIRFGIFCRAHHFEMLMGRPYGL